MACRRKWLWRDPFVARNPECYDPVVLVPRSEPRRFHGTFDPETTIDAHHQPNLGPSRTGSLGKAFLHDRPRTVGVVFLEAYLGTAKRMLVAEILRNSHRLRVPDTLRSLILDQFPADSLQGFWSPDYGRGLGVDLHELRKIAERLVSVRHALEFGKFLDGGGPCTSLQMKMQMCLGQSDD